MALSEFELIQTCFAEFAADIQREDIKLGIGDDCAILTPLPGKDLVASVDTLVAGVHFPHSATPYQIARRALAVNLSDLAAMGAEPAWFTLALTLAESDEAWLREFSHGLFEEANRDGIALVGGDTTRGPLSLTIQVQGYVDADSALRRDGANVGDVICVTGTLGDAGAGLGLVNRPEPSTDSNAQWLLDRFYFPEARLSVGKALVGLANAALDISDGLLADLGHVLTRSGVGAEIELKKLPISSALAAVLGEEAARELALSAGDDYELCFCVPAEKLEAVQAVASATGVQIKAIGRITAKPELVLLDAEGQPKTVSKQGYRHF